MLSINKCKNVLNQKEKKYTTEQVKIIRGHLYNMTLLIDELNPNQNESS